MKAHEVAETVIRCLKVHAGLTSARQVPRVVSALSTAISKPLEHNIQSGEEELTEVDLSSEKSEVGCCFRPCKTCSGYVCAARYNPPEAAHLRRDVRVCQVLEEKNVDRHVHTQWWILEYLYVEWYDRLSGSGLIRRRLPITYK